MAFFQHFNLPAHALRGDKQRFAVANRFVQIQVEPGVPGTRVFGTIPTLFHPVDLFAVIATIGRRPFIYLPRHELCWIQVFPVQRSARACQCTLGAHHQPSVLSIGTRAGDLEIQHWRVWAVENKLDVILGVAQGQRPLKVAEYLWFVGPKELQRPAGLIPIQWMSYRLW